MEEDSHWTTTVRCNMCGKIPEMVPLYQCPIEHQYCMDCYLKLRASCNGSAQNETTCLVCKATGIFTHSKINMDYLGKIKSRPGIGRPYRYNINEIANKECANSRPSTSKLPKHQSEPKITLERLFGLPSKELELLLSRKTKTSEAVPPNEPHCLLHELSPRPNSAQSISQQSKTPIKCPHGSCKKMITTSTLISHFKHDHADIPSHDIRRDRELCLTLNVTDIKHNNHHCLGIITVYEPNTTAIDTCKQYVPVDSFWLLVTGFIGPYDDEDDALIIIWLFCPCQDSYHTTIELSSKSGTMAFSTYCEVHTSAQNLEFEDIASKLHCLLLGKTSVAALLEDGPELDLSITIH
ncbi:uncharacterized protein LOC130451479 isoform X1 [Diorhabda sublineata]|uniref:uncharacterized protein LOC130451479 isoform X1 n=1 Tax=Diorhabda sublineata TaxID=1163346 RepID=UPI0024E089A4|nr:uncharacterized protein LOC130451479 isoform X1 [Diorhabda sublineata]XP_056646489.1 uncharacterized protein LOC130451479 isoform X1 [Diorhabda sublineata]